MRVAAVGLCFSLLLACNRTEPSHSVEAARGASATPPDATPPSAEKSVANAKPTPPPSVASTATKCVVPLAEEPARRAPKALHCPADPEHPPELAHGYVVFSDAPGSPRLNVELARTEPEKERGLMYRTNLPDDQGMLFSWNNEEPRRFWMHNTCIPLDMMFIARDGTISGILEQVPTLNDEPRGVPCADAYVLEVNAGWSRAHGIEPGTVVHFE